MESRGKMASPSLAPLAHLVPRGPLEPQGLKVQEALQASTVTPAKTA